MEARRKEPIDSSSTVLKDGKIYTLCHFETSVVIHLQFKADFTDFTLTTLDLMLLGKGWKIISIVVHCCI